MTGQVSGKVAIVTGGASGIGQACAELLAREGASVVVTDLDEQGGREVVAGITKQGHKAIFLPQDVTSEPRWAEVASEIDRQFGRLDVLVSNAGISMQANTLEMSLADWRRLMAVNLDAVFLSVKHCVPLMRKTGGGSVIMMSSGAGLFGVGTRAAYCASKGGVRLLAKAVAQEFAADGIRVNSVHPGIIVTPIFAKMTKEASGAGNFVQVDPAEQAKKVVPMGRAGQPLDVAQTVLHLASDASSFVTGAEFPVDGGRSSGMLQSNAR